MDISIPGLAAPITGSAPIVILGANGSGKRRLAVEMTRSVGAEFIPALRNIALPDQVPNWTLQTGTHELINRTHQRQNSYWELIHDFDALFGKVWSSHAVEAMRVYDQLLYGKTPDELPDTVLTKTRELWRRVFPGRSISFNDFSAKIANEYLGSSTYTAKHMSDGERTGLYLAAKILDTGKAVVVIDEPETHFPSRLAVRFWDALESLCPDKRFVYVTHDHTFTLSRKDASIVLARPSTSPELIELGTALPSEDVASILGAASFSANAKRLVFCEGREEKSLDQELLRAWFNDKETALIPVGGSDNVKRCTAAFEVSAVVSGFNAVGIVDRRHCPDELLDGLQNVNVLRVHEVQSLYVLKPVYTAIAIHSGHRPEVVDQMYSSLLDGLRQQMRGVLANKLIGERFKAKSMMVVEMALSGAVARADRAQLKAALVGRIASVRPVTDPESIWLAEEAAVETALASPNPEVFHRVFPAKAMLGIAASSIGISKERYCEIVKSALISSEPAFAVLRAAVEQALAPYLPPRSMS